MEIKKEECFSPEVPTGREGGGGRGPWESGKLALLKIDRRSKAWIAPQNAAKLSALYEERKTSEPDKR